MKFFKNNYAVSHLIGYTLTLSLTAIIATATVISTNNIIEDKKRDAAQLYAESIADQVSDAIVSVCLIKEQYPNANYSKVIDLPEDLVGYSYYIQATNETIFVNSTNGLISATSPTYNVSSRLGIDLNDKVYGVYGAVNISCWPFDYSHKFDFGPENGTGTKGYIKVSNYSSIGYPDYDSRAFSDTDYDYMRVINISNPTNQYLRNYQILIQLDDTNFNYEHLNCNGTDIKFVYRNGYRNKEQELYYWVERWNPQDTHTSRVWVKIPEIAPAGCNISMYYGNDDADKIYHSNRHDAGHVFVFFDNFTGASGIQATPDSTKWDTPYTPEASSDVYVENEMLYLSDKSALRSRSNITVGENPCVIEAKAKTVGDNTREASMFVRNNGDDPPYEHGYILESGNFSEDNGYNLSLLRYYSGEKVLNYSTAAPVDENWYRLTYILNDSDHIACRYFYSNYTLDGYAVATDSTYPLDGQFGLCTQRANTEAYFDWIYVRNYSANTDDEVKSREESIPVATVGGEITDNELTGELKVYQWEGITASLPSYKIKGVERPGGTINCDFIANTSSRTPTPTTFKINNLGSNEVYSIALTLGDKENKLEHLSVQLSDSYRIIDTISDITCNPYKKIWVSNFAVNGYLKITFDDADDATTTDDYYWAVSELVLQRGERKIHLTGGR